MGSRRGAEATNPPAAGTFSGVPVTIDELTVADEPAAWADRGFTVEDGVCVLGGVRIRLVGRGESKGLVGWSLRGIATEELDGLPTSSSDRSPPELGTTHANGIDALDHVVAITPALERTVAALEAAGLDLRRVREEPTPAGAPRQAFFRIGAEILEVVQEPADVVERGGANRPAFFWGLAMTAADLDASVARLGEHVGEIRPAIQPGRRIATLRRSAGLSLPVALMTPS